MSTKIVASIINNYGSEYPHHRQVAKVPGGYRLIRTYPYTHTWPVRATIEVALKDSK